jgi:hypothetical protein
MMRTMASVEDPLIEEHVEHALAPYRGILPPEDLEGFREMLVLFYSAHPVAVEALDQLRTTPAVESSGKVLKRDDAALEEASARQKKRARGGRE